ncbi:MAG: hypothetical protein JKY87_03720 [Mariprofundus sp.]|nr:hypothetical protein [Mariprofundus sp.]
MKHHIIKLMLGLMLLLFLNACGLKEAPQVIVDSSITPKINDLRYHVSANILRLDFKLTGDVAGVGYQIDRTRVDPYCQCPGFWRRFFEQPTLARQVNEDSYKIIRLTTGTDEFLFRIRAIDVSGNFGPWSKIIRAQADMSQ